MRHSHRTGIAAAVLVLCGGVPAGCMGQHYDIETHRSPIQIGEDTVQVVTYEAAAPGLTYLNLHDNENTSVDAVLEVIGRRGGRLVELRHDGERNISFRLQDMLYTFDPNRIFTDAGLEATLRGLGPYSEEAHQAVRAFADSVLQFIPIPGADLVATVHNNTQGEYSTLSYTNDGEYVTDALFVHVSDDQDADNFFFVTDQDLYDRMRNAEFNVVLQNNTRVLDDGSLSVYAGALGIPYVNVEAQHGEVDAQIRMLEYLNELLVRP